MPGTAPLGAGFGRRAAAPVGQPMRKPVASVGELSTVPYGATNGFANANGVTGFVGPPAGSLQQPTNWYVRTSGSNNNGGTSVAVDRSGSDGVTNGTTTFTSASAAFTSADVGKGICINTGANARRHRIASVTNATTVILDRTSSSASGLAWVIGGPWADLRAALGDAAVSADTNSPVRAGDNVYVGAGTYRAIYSVGLAPAANGTVDIVGDVFGQYTGDAGMVQLTAYVTNDKTAPSATAFLVCNNKTGFAFSNLMFVGGANTMVSASGSQNISFQDCAFMSGNVGGQALMFSITAAAGVALGWAFDRCQFLTGRNTAGQTFTINLNGAAAGADWDANFSFRNCLFIVTGSNANPISVAGGSTTKGGGVRVYNTTFVGGVITIAAGAASTTYPSVVDNCFIYGGGTVTALNAGTSGQIVEDYNLITAGTPRANVTAGTHSISDGSYSPLFHWGQERIWNGLLRQFGEPMSGSPLLGFGNDGGQTAYDFIARPRPAGGGSGFPAPAAGAMERGSTSSQASSPAPSAGTYDWQFTGPGYQDFLLPVAAASNGLTIQVQRDSAYSPYPGGTLPAMLILANPRIGVSAQAVVDTGSAGAWNTLTAAPFTPTGSGWVTVRVVSYDGTGTSVVSFAVFTDS